MEGPVPGQRAYGPTLGDGLIRQYPQDFQVVEIPVFEATGCGEHAVLNIRKTGVNTDQVAAQLASLAGVSRRAVGYAGRKDRNAVAEQWFSVHLPGRPDPDWHTLDSDTVKILAAGRHQRKIHKGALRGNRFRITIRRVRLTAPGLEQRLATLQHCGVPNYFGPQRFGHGGSNLDHARQWFMAPRRKGRPRNLDLWLSSARALIFNRVLAERVAASTWNTPLAGERLMLAGSRSHFLCQQVDDEILERARRLQLHPGGPLWGRGEPEVLGELLALETRIAAAEQVLADGLQHCGLRQERRALRATVHDLSWSRPEPELLVLEFWLERGCFATTVLQELLDTGSGSPVSG